MKGFFLFVLVVLLIKSICEAETSAGSCEAKKFGFFCKTSVKYFLIKSVANPVSYSGSEAGGNQPTGLSELLFLRDEP